MLFDADGKVQAHSQAVTPDLTENEREEAEQRTSVKAHVVHEAIRIDGNTELERATSALAVSGLAAGLSMGFSLIGEGLFRSHLPDADWRPLVSRLGYSFGFLIIIIGRQQLFTENTLTAVLPVLSERSWSSLVRMLRLWAIVLAANLTGAHIVAWVLGNTHAFAPAVQHAFALIAKETAAVTPGEAVLRGVFAGWLIAMLVWMRAALDSGHIPLIVLITYLVAIGGFTHIIAGSVDVLFLVFTGVIPWTHWLIYFMLPTLCGNTLGGVSLVAGLNHAQVFAGKQQV
ncbi:MAG TPA: formate/nitrite transporter family protein [Bryobacteraceae bacterium]|jgi:formate/nitrite transporter FocA (FNT family)|nr:formate/nitrite transporter family protein [Bryobacteraceae bacterium]